jgi:brefeldin A-inhibited guanine nucleotide-exchange protein
MGCLCCKGCCDTAPTGIDQRHQLPGDAIVELDQNRSRRPAEEDFVEVPGASGPERIEYDKLFKTGISKFNSKPEKGIDFLRVNQYVGQSAEDVAKFLKDTKGLSMTKIGEYLGSLKEANQQVLKAYVQLYDFTNQAFDEALRSFLGGFRLPGEAQVIDRMMSYFGERYCACNASTFPSTDSAYVLAFSVIMLNTDLHSPQVKKKMTKQEFMYNNMNIHESINISEELLSDMYDRIQASEIKIHPNACRYGECLTFLLPECEGWL